MKKDRNIVKDSIGTIIGDKNKQIINIINNPKEDDKFKEVKEEIDKDFSSYFYVLKEVYSEFVKKGYNPSIKVDDWIEINEFSQNRYSNYDYSDLIKEFSGKAVYFRMAYKLNKLMKKYIADVTYNDNNSIVYKGKNFSKCSFLFLNSENSFGFWYNIKQFNFEDKESIKNILENKYLRIKTTQEKEKMDIFFQNLNTITWEMFGNQMSLSEIKQVYFRYFDERANKFNLKKLIAFQGILYPENFVEDIYSGELFKRFDIENDPIALFKLFKKFAVAVFSNNQYYIDSFEENISKRMEMYFDEFPIMDNNFVYRYLLDVKDKREIPNDFTMFMLFIAVGIRGTVYNNDELRRFFLNLPKLKITGISNFDLKKEECERLVNNYLSKLYQDMKSKNR